MASATASLPTRLALHYRTRSLWLSALYLPLLIIPWVITCIMMFRPMRKSSYNEHVGTDLFTDQNAREIGRWLTAVSVVSTISTVIALPVISALLAQAAVRYSQRRREGQTLSLAQLVTLANGGWTDLSSLNDARLLSPLSLFGMLLVIVTLIQPPIQSLMVRYENTAIATCWDVPHSSYGSRGVTYPPSCYGSSSSPMIERQLQKWYDPEPGDLEHCPQGLVISRVIDKLNNIRDDDAQAHLWSEAGERPKSTDYIRNPTTFLSWKQSNSRWNFFASSLPAGTTTGVLRYHAMRQQSEPHCNSVTQDSFPSICAGDSPFSTTFSHKDVVVRICVPGTVYKSPWTRTRNRQTIEEELWIDVQLARKSPTQGDSFTTQCRSTSTRGYFELGNQHNGYVQGPLLEKWPSEDELLADFNDVTGHLAIPIINGPLPAEMASARPGDGVGIDWETPGMIKDTDLPTFWGYPTPGPLMTSALALFGNTSLFRTATDATNTSSVAVLRTICHLGTVPLEMFLRDEIRTSGPSLRSLCFFFSPSDNEKYIQEGFINWVSGFVSLFSSTGRAQEILAISMFAANEALLTATAESSLGMYSREIASSSGYEILKPVKSIPTIVVVSVLLFLQVAAIVGLVVYNSSFPTWTTSLDGLAMAKIGRELKHSDLAPLGVEDMTEIAKLARAEGIVGLVDTEADTYLKAEEATPVLGLGASGVITRAAR